MLHERLDALALYVDHGLAADARLDVMAEPTSVVTHGAVASCLAVVGPAVEPLGDGLGGWLG